MHSMHYCYEQSVYVVTVFPTRFVIVLQDLLPEGKKKNKDKEQIKITAHLVRNHSK